MNKKYNISVGEQFHWLAVVDNNSRNERNHLRITCRCVCGTTKQYLPNNLVIGHTKSCGCMKSQIIKDTHTKIVVGTKIGKLTVIEDYNRRNKFNRRIFLVRCECGMTKDMPLTSDSISCGCARLSKNPIATEYNRYKNSCIKRQLPFDLSKEEFGILLLGACYYCGDPPGMNMHAGKLLRNGIDRLDNDQGYQKNNCVSCCANCNFAKRKLSSQEFFEMIRKIFSRHLS